MTNSKEFPRLLELFKQLGFGENNIAVDSLITKMNAAEMEPFKHIESNVLGHDVVASFNHDEREIFERVTFVIELMENSFTSLTPILSQSYQYSRRGVSVDMTGNILYDKETRDIYLLDRIDEGDLLFQIGRIPNADVAIAEAIANNMKQYACENGKKVVVYYDHVTANMPKAKPASPSLLP